MERTIGKRYRYVFTAIVYGLVLILSFLFWDFSSENSAFASESSSYAVLETRTHRCVLEQNAHVRLPMASTTKIMTALLIVENCDLNEKILIDNRAIGIEGSSVYLKKGESLTVRELLYCMMLRSGNDSAVALALHMANSVEDFAEMMNVRAESLGLRNTHFTNPHGLHDDNHYTSAYDLGIISCVAMENDLFRKIVGTYSIKIGEGESARFLQNKNKMLRLYEGANGIKTGFTKKSGRCLVSSANREGTNLICVVLNQGDTYGLSMRLLDEGFRMINVENA